MAIVKKYLMISGAVVGLGISGAIAQHALSQPERTEQQKQILAEITSKVLAQLDKIKQQKPKLREDLGENIIDGEEAAIKSATDAVIKTIMNRAFSNATPGIAKGDHGKSLACLKGSIQFNKDIPDVLQRGVVVPEAVYDVEGRLSNAEEPGRSDRSSTSQGVALKLKGLSRVIGKKTRLPDFPDSDQQDFLMTSATTFFLSNIVEYNVAFSLRAGGGKVTETLGTIITNKMLWPRLITEVQAKMRSLAPIPGGPKNIMTHPYWSKHPYAWGEATEKSVAVKYGVAPCDNSQGLTPSSSADNYQADFIKEAFQKNNQICFHLRVQVRPQDATEVTYPIEDGNVEWKEDTAPFVNVAKVVFGAQENSDWNSKTSQDACVKTEFSPWNGLIAHQPLSNLARGRRDVYKASALVRELKDSLDLKISEVKDLPKKPLRQRLNPVRLFKKK